MKAILFVYTIIYGANNFICTCIPMSVGDNVKKSSFIFTGTVLKINTVMITDEDIPKNAFRIRYLATLKVKEVFKGQRTNDTMHIITGEGMSDCGYFFESSKDYLIYAKEEKYAVIDTLEIVDAKYPSHEMNYLTTTICDRTTPTVKKERKLLRYYLSKSKSIRSSQ